MRVRLEARPQPRRLSHDRALRECCVQVFEQAWIDLVRGHVQDAWWCLLGNEPIHDRRGQRTDAGPGVKKADVGRQSPDVHQAGHQLGNRGWGEELAQLGPLLDSGCARGP